MFLFEWSQIGTVQAVGYIGVRSRTKGSEHKTNQLLESNANDICCWCIHKALYSTVQELRV